MLLVVLDRTPFMTVLWKVFALFFIPTIIHYMDRRSPVILLFFCLHALLDLARPVWLGMWDTEWVRAIFVHIGYREHRKHTNRNTYFHSIGIAMHIDCEVLSMIPNRTEI